MSMYNRLHFYKRFYIGNDFIAIKNFETGGIEYKPGMRFDKNCMPAHKVKAMFNSRKITYADAMFNPAEIVSALTNDQEYDTINLVPEIKKGAFGWLTVSVNGKQIGSKTKDAEEANRIVNEWLASPD